MTTREILTIQLGHYSNFIGTHWWNIQESGFSYDPETPSEINHDVLYREGVLQKQVTYTPRLLIADLNGSLGTFSEKGGLYDDDQVEEDFITLWDKEKSEITHTDPPKEPTNAEKHEPVDYENTVHSWVDYLETRFHPRTINIVKQYKHDCTTHPFDIFTYGQNLWNATEFTDNFTDRIRTYVEECDLMQGFQILVDSTDGFAGLGVACTQYLRDEYGKSILTFPCTDPSTNEPSAADLIKAVNTALCWQHIGEHSSLFSPLCCGKTCWPTVVEPRNFENLTYDLKLKYHTGAILATALDTLTLRYRRKEYPSVVLSDLCADLNKLGRKAAATSLSLPFPMTVKTDLIDVLDDFEGTLWTSLTPSCEISMDRNMQSIALRGVPEDRLKRPLQDASKQTRKPAYRCSSVHEMMTLYLACTCHTSATYLSTVSSPLTIKDPYPKIFNNNVTERGDIAGWPVGTEVDSVPVMAGLHSGSELSLMYESLHTQVSRIKNIKKYHVFTDSGLEQDDYTDCLNHLLDCKEAYEDHYT